MFAAHRTLAFLLLCLTPFAAHAKDGEFVWARISGGASDDLGRSIAVDSAGNVYTMGYFADEVDFDPGATTYRLTSAGNSDIFLQKLDANGGFVWARRMGGGNLERGEAFSVDGAGNVYTTGYFAGTVDFDPGEGVFNLTNAGYYDTFVQKLDVSGNLVWAGRIGGINTETASGIAVDDSGNVYTTGTFDGTTDFDPSEDNASLTSVGCTDFFVHKLDVTGSLVWVRHTGGRGCESAYAIAVDNADNVYTVGKFNGTLDFDPGEDTVNLTSAIEDTDAIFVQKLDASGNFVWARQVVGATNKQGSAIAADGTGNVYITGYFSGTADFDPSVETFNLVSAGNNDYFIMKLDSRGNLDWAMRMGGIESERGVGIAVNNSGDIHTTGYFAGRMDFDPSTATYDLTSSGGEDIFVQKVDTNGNFVWARRMGGSSFDRGLGIAVDGTGDVHTVGYFAESVDFDPRVGIFSLTSTGNSDIFVQKLGPDVTPPNVVSVYPGIEGPTNSASADFVVTFDEEVRSFNDEADLEINHNGTVSAGATISGGPSIFTATIDGISGEGSLTLAVNTESDVKDFAGNPLASSVTSLALLIDTILPTVSIGEPIGSPVNFLHTASYPIMIDGASQIDLSSAEVTINHNGTAGGSVNVLNGASATPTVQVKDVTGSGSYTISIAAGIATDEIANTSLAAGPSAAVIVDNTSPTVSIGASSGLPVNSNGTATYSVTVDGASSINLSSAEVTINYNGCSGGSVLVLDGSTANPSIHITGVTGDGSYTISIAASIASDLAGNFSRGAGPSAAVAVDNTPPTVSIGEATGSPVNSGGMATYPVEINGAESIALTSGDVTINHNGTAGGSVEVVEGTTAAPSVQVTGVTGDGSYTVSIAPGIATDAAGNASVVSGPSAAVSVDNKGPEFANLVVSPVEASTGDTVTISFDCSEPIAGDPEVTVNGNLAIRTAKTDFTYAYTVSPEDALGAAIIEVSGADLLGNPGTLSDGISLTIVQTEREGSTEGASEGVVEGVIEGAIEGAIEGVVEGVADGEGAVDGEGVADGEGASEGTIEGTQEGEGEGVVEGAEEGEGEGENPPTGCGGCNAAGGPMEKSLGDWLAVFLGFAVLLGAHLSLRSRLEG